MTLPPLFDARGDSALGPDFPLDPFGRSPLARLAARSGTPSGAHVLELAADILARGADPDWRDARGRTPLMLAAGAGIDAADQRGMTPLAWSCASSPALGRRGVWRLLFELGADLRFVDFRGNGFEYHFHAQGRHDPEFLSLVRASIAAANERDAIDAATAPAVKRTSLARI